MAAKKKTGGPKKKAPGGVKTARSAKSATKRVPATKTGKRAPAKKVAAAQPVVHWEIQARDPVKIQKFYGELFSWKITGENPTNYGMVASKAGEFGIDGGIGAAAGKSQVTFYVQVEDIPATLKKCTRLGGKTIMPRTDLGMVTMAMLQDVEGNQIGLIEA